TLTPMLNAYLNRKEIKRTRFYEATEPYFEKMENNYKASLVNFLSKKWMVAPIMAVVLGILLFFGSKLNSELAPLDDRSSLSLNFLGPEGLSFDAMDSFIQKVTAVV